MSDLPRTDTDKLDEILKSTRKEARLGRRAGEEALTFEQAVQALLKWRDEAVVAELENLTELPNIQVPAGMHVQAVYTSVIKARIKQLEGAE